MSKRTRGRLALAAVSAGATVSGIGLMAPTASAAATITVDNTVATCSNTAGSPVYCDINTAIAAAGAGGTVDVLQGTYTGPVVVSGAGANGLTLLGHGKALISGGVNGFQIGNVSGVTVDGFTVQNTQNAGFQLGDHRGTAVTRWVTDNLTLSNNSVFQAGGAKAGTAAASAAGFDADYVTNSTFSHNQADGNNDYGFFINSASNGNKLLHNEASGNVTPGTRRANGIDIQASNNNTVDGNVLHDNQDSGLQFYVSDSNIARNNVVYRNGDHGVDNLNSTHGVLLNNTAYDNCTAGINVEGKSVAAFGYVVENNIAVDNGTDTTCAHGPVGLDHSGQGGQVRIADIGINDATTIDDYNLVATAAPGVLVPVTNARQISATSHDVLNADPLFANPAGGDFSISGASPAVGKADPNPVTDDDPFDITGAPRPTPGSIGAYEGAPAAAPPKAFATWSLTGFAPNAKISIDATGSYPGQNPGTPAYSIDFDSAHPGGAGNVVTTPTATHTYTTAGTYDVAVTITDAAGTNTQHYQVVVTAKPAIPALVVTPAAQPSLQVSASAAGSTAGSAPIAGYSFDFGDGTAAVATTAPTATAAHTYTASGTYTVAVTVTDTNGLKSSTTQSVTVGAPAVLLNQIGGQTRYQTGVLVSQHRWQTGQADAVVLATGRTFADALAGVPLAAKAGGPLLLVDGQAGTVDPAVAAEIGRVLKPGGQVYILGGTAAVSQGIQNQLAGQYQVSRFQGANRYLTSVDIAVRGLGSPQHVVVATGNGFADALASGPLATGPFADGPGAPAAIVLSNDRVLDPAVAGYLAAKSSANIATIGHQAAAAVPSAGRSYAGATRYDTDQQVAGAFTGASAAHQVGVADGMNFPDALTGGAYMASLANPGPVVLVDGYSKTVPVQASAVLSGHRTDVEADIFGGPAVVTPVMAATVMNDLGAVLVNHIGF